MVAGFSAFNRRARLGMAAQDIFASNEHKLERRCALQPTDGRVSDPKRPGNVGLRLPIAQPLVHTFPQSESESRTHRMCRANAADTTVRHVLNRQLSTRYWQA